MGTRNALAIDLGRRRLRVVQAVVSRTRVSVTRTLVQEAPTDVNLDDADSAGRWLAQCLTEAGFQRGPATLSVGREHVGLKRITLPTVDAAELPDMTRLAVQRELPFDADDAVIDFAPVERSETSTTVLAVAVPRKQIDFMQRMADAAGLKVQRIALRTMGAAALMNTLADAPAGGVRVEDVGAMAEGIEAAGPAVAPEPALLAVDVVGEGVEFCILAGGAIRFSRAAEVPAPQDELAMADAVVTEARRTWMSYRVGDEAGGIGAAVIMGDRRVAEYAAGPVGEMLKMPVRVLHEHPRINAGGHDLSRLWPLAGLLLESHGAGERIDFLHPRRAPDLAARRRQRWLAAAAILILLGGAAFTLFRRDLEGLRLRAETLARQRTDGANGYARSFRDKYKVEHLKQWSSVEVDWLEHAAFLAQVAPPPEQIVLDSWSGALDFPGVTFDSKTFKWAAPHQATIVIDGEARNRSTADTFRGALMQSATYTASTTGADARGGKRMPFGFTYRLRTRAAAPQTESTGEPNATPAAMTGESGSASQAVKPAAEAQPVAHSAVDPAPNDPPSA